MDKSKKIIIVVAIILFIVAIGVGVYFGLQKSRKVINNNFSAQNNSQNNVVNTTNNNNQTQNLIPLGNVNNNQNNTSGVSATHTILRITKNLSIDFWVHYGINASSSSSTNVSVIYINGNNEIIEKDIDNNGKENKISSVPNGKKPVKVVSNIDGSFVAIKFSDYSWALFDYENKIWEDLGANIESVSFSSNSDKVAYIKKVKDGSEIYVYDFSKSKTKLILLSKLPVFDYKILWPSKNEIILAPRPSAKFRSELLKIDIEKSKVYPILSNFGEMINFNNGVGVVSYANNKGFKKSYIINSNFDNLYSFAPGLFIIPDKCGFYGNFAFCAMSNFNYDGNSHIIPDDYLSGEVYSHDTLYRFAYSDSGGLDKKMILDGSKYELDITKIKAISDNTIFFRNRFDGGVYEIKVLDDTNSDAQ